MRQYDSSSRVEQVALERSGKADRYAPREKISVVEVPDFPTLGQLAAVRFLEWLQLNPEGVIALPTGKTPEHFIKWTVHLLRHWKDRPVQRLLGQWGLDTARKPAMAGFTFVQIDEFFPMNPAQENSFAHYIDRFYFRQFGLDRDKALLIDSWHVGAPVGGDLGSVFPEGHVDLSLRFRSPADELEQLQYRAITAADQFAMAYEERIRQLGGIGFFLGGIGPDGHIGFNIRGTGHFTTTSLAPINYETAAAAAADLGGIEAARRKAVMTIGLKTITYNPTATAIIIAAGETKAQVVRDAIENEPSVLYPATALQALPGSRFYLNRGAASLLVERRRNRLRSAGRISAQQAHRILIDIASQHKKKISELDPGDLQADPLGQVLLDKNFDLGGQVGTLSAALEKKIKRGLQTLKGMTFLHTAPHHDDIMLGYLPYILHLVRQPQNAHYFATLTSGFTSVTNSYTLCHLQNLQTHLQTGRFKALIDEGYFAPHELTGRNRDLYQYLDGVAAGSVEMQKEGEARRMLRNLVELAQTEELRTIWRLIRRLQNDLAGAYPGKKDDPTVQKLKGMIREWEEELLWAHLGFDCRHVFHLRLGFYTGDIFTPQPRWDLDVKPVLKLLEKLNPDVITVALDPEASGPDTHYKVLQTISEALRAYLRRRPNPRLRIWGYRNVWFRFHPAEADVFVPVSMNSLAIMNRAFHTCFGSQRSASFPSHEYDGPFCDLAQKIMVEQFAVIKTCLGRNFFYNNKVPRLRATRGLNFLRSMTAQQFLDQATSLKKMMETQAPEQAGGLP